MFQMGIYRRGAGCLQSSPKQKHDEAAHRLFSWYMPIPTRTRIDYTLFFKYEMHISASVRWAAPLHVTSHLDEINSIYFKFGTNTLFFGEEGD